MNISQANTVRKCVAVVVGSIVCCFFGFTADLSAWSFGRRKGRCGILRFSGTTASFTLS